MRKIWFVGVKSLAVCRTGLDQQWWGGGCSRLSAKLTRNWEVLKGMCNMIFSTNASAIDSWMVKFKAVECSWMRDTWHELCEYCFWRNRKKWEYANGVGLSPWVCVGVPLLAPGERIPAPNVSCKDGSWVEQWMQTFVTRNVRRWCSLKGYWFNTGPNNVNNVD